MNWLQVLRLIAWIVHTLLSTTPPDNLTPPPALPAE